MVLYQTFTNGDPGFKFGQPEGRDLDIGILLKYFGSKLNHQELMYVVHCLVVLFRKCSKYPPLVKISTESFPCIDYIGKL